MRIKDLPATTSVSGVDYVIVDQGASNPVTRRATLASVLGQSAVSEALTSVSGIDTISGTSSQIFTAYAPGQRFQFATLGGNLGPVTLNVNNRGAKSVVAVDGTALTAGALPASTWVTVEYNGTDFTVLGYHVLRSSWGAAAVGYTPTGTVAATTVQGAIDEVVSDLANPPGSSLVGFLQSGDYAQPRTAQSKLRDTVSAKDFGAAGDGAVDDTTSIQNAIDAINAAGGGTLFFPAGTYKITSSLVMKLNVCLRGAGRRISKIVQFTNSTDCLSFARTQGLFNDIYDLQFTVNAGVTGVTLLNIGSNAGTGNVGNSNISGCAFINGATAVTIDAGYNNNIIGNYFSGQTSGGVRLVGTGGANANNVLNNTFDTLTGDCVYIARTGGLATYQVSVNNNTFKSITGNGINCPQDGSYTFSGNYFDTVSGSEIIAPGTANVVAIGNYSSAGASVVDLSSAARGGFFVTPVTATGDVKANLGGSVITSNGNTRLDITNSQSANQIWNFDYTDLRFNTVGRGIDFFANSGAPGATSKLLTWYEEGTWTPEYATTGTQFTSITYNIQQATYTRVGRAVHVKMRIRTNAATVGSASGGLIIRNLPFSAAAFACPLVIGYADNFTTNAPISAEVTSSGTTIALYYRSTVNGSVVTLQFSHLNTGASANDLTISGTYFA